jgi:hypothetical protein
VARIWRKWDLQPHRIEGFKFSTDPELEFKIRDVVGLYLDPPANAVVVSVDEKSQMQAYPGDDPGVRDARQGADMPGSRSAADGLARVGRQAAVRERTAMDATLVLSWRYPRLPSPARVLVPSSRTPAEEMARGDLKTKTCIRIRVSRAH